VKTTVFGLLLAASLAVASANAQVSCSRSITSCGCTITQRGAYSVDANLSASQGLTALNGCIDITLRTRNSLSTRTSAGIRPEPALVSMCCPLQNTPFFMGLAVPIPVSM
jgi:hypothetical protein